jgi:hypothetical protein
MCPIEKRIKLTELSNKYRYAFYLIGTPDTGYNKMRIASFLSTKKPREYEIFLEDDHKTVVFWNPHDNKNQIEQS